MLIGVPKETKTHEYRVGLTPGSVRELVHHGHRVVVETGAGAGIGFDDAAYETAGARVVGDAGAVFAAAEMIVKVKEPQPPEIALLRRGQILFTYLHLAADRELAAALIASQAVAIAYETVTDARGGLPLLAPMSEVAGRMAVQVGAHCLEKEQGGIGVLLGGVPGVPPPRWSSSAAASPEPMPPAWRWGWKPMSRSSTALCRGFTSSICSSARSSTPFTQPWRISSARWRPPIWSSVRC
jgi:alanine dehydrogenase